MELMQDVISDLTAEIFLALRGAFFGDNLAVEPFELRHKRNTQDDPLDEYIHSLLSSRLGQEISSLKAPGPLITPDLVVMRPAMCEAISRLALAVDLTRIVGIEVKKLERTPGGAIARAGGLDYNTTPPCGTIRVY